LRVFLQRLADGIKAFGLGGIRNPQVIYESLHLRRHKSGDNAVALRHAGAVKIRSAVDKRLGAAKGDTIRLVGCRGGTDC